MIPWKCEPLEHSLLTSISVFKAVNLSRNFGFKWIVFRQQYLSENYFSYSNMENNQFHFSSPNNNDNYLWRDIFWWTHFLLGDWNKKRDQKGRLINSTFDPFYLLFTVNLKYVFMIEFLYFIGIVIVLVIEVIQTQYNFKGNSSFALLRASILFFLKSLK